MSSRAAIIGLAFLAIAIAGLVVFMRTSNWAAVDRCLDSGGRWDYEAQLCQH